MESNVVGDYVEERHDLGPMGTVAYWAHRNGELTAHNNAVCQEKQAVVAAEKALQQAKARLQKAEKDFAEVERRFAWRCADVVGIPLRRLHDADRVFVTGPDDCDEHAHLVILKAK